MPPAKYRTYLFRARNNAGRPITDRVMAPSATNAVETLHASGYTDIELLTDDLTALVGEDETEAARIRKRVRPDIMVRLQSATRAQARWLAIYNAYRSFVVPLVLASSYFVFRRYHDRPFEFFDYAFCVLAPSPVFIILFLFRRSDRYDEAQRALIEARYENALRLIEKLEPSLGKHSASIAAQLATWKASALAQLGRPDDAWEVMQRVRDIPGSPEAAYHVRLADFYAATHDYEQVRACYEEALRIDPDSPSPWLGLAEVLAIRLHDTEGARAALDQLTRFPIGPDTRRGIEIVEGAIALEEGQLDVARTKLTACHAELARVALRVPIAIAFQRYVEALLVVTCVGQRDRLAAEQYYSECKDFLQLHGEHDMLDRCKTALGGLSTSTI